MALFRTPKRVVNVNPARLAGGRQSMDGWKQLNQFAVIEPDRPEEDWRVLELDSKTLDRISVDDLLVILASVSPDVSRAVWDFMRMFNPGWTVEARKPGAADDSEVDPVAQAAVDQFIDDLKALYVTPDVIWNKMLLGAYIRGAFCVELVLSRNGRLPVDIATPDPVSIRFKRKKDAERGIIHIPGQWQNGDFVEFKRPTFMYVPVDAMPGSPYGRSPSAPALFTALFMIGMLHDLRRVIAQQGYPRIDIAIDLEKLATAMPADLEGDPEAFTSWINKVVADVQSVYSNLEPDDAYVHTDTVKINRPVGTVDAQSLGAIEGIIKALERMSIKALKTMPLLMGISEASTETHAARQWEVYSQGVRSLQHLAEAMLERVFTLALQAQGVAADVKFRFAELRNSEELRDEQVRSLKITNTKEEYAAGWIDQEEAAQKVVGHPPAEEEPRSDPGDIAMEQANDLNDAAKGEENVPADSQKRTISETDIAEAMSLWEELMGVKLE